MATTVIVGDRHGRKLAEINAFLDVVTWQLNKAGKTTLIVSNKDAKYRSDYLRLANRVFIQFDNGLSWGGTMEPDWEWGKDAVKIPCYSIDWRLQHRITAKNAVYPGMSVGAIFASAISSAQTVDSLGIEVGQCWLGGAPHSQVYHHKKLSDVLTDLAKLENCDFRFVPQMVGDHISFLAECHRQLGSDKSDKVALLEGKNVSEAIVKEVGPIYNSWTTAGQGTVWDDSRPTKRFEDTSWRDIGLREGFDTLSGTSGESSLAQHSKTKVETQSRPRLRAELQVANKAPGLFSDYDIGDTVRLVLPSYCFSGVDTTVRITAREYNPGTEACKVIAEEPVDSDWSFAETATTEA
jgi:hypothetical protein